MDIFAWIGVLGAGALLLLYALCWIIAALRSEIGRGALMGLGILLIIAWGVLGAFWLIGTKVM
jgi:hypothetical protein